MKLFVSEFVCGGGWSVPELPHSLAAEGGAMLHALCEDLSGLPNVTVTTTLDRRCDIALPESTRVVIVKTPDEEPTHFLRLAAEADVSIVIAPELDDTLTRRVTSARNAGANVLAPPEDVIQLCSDKLRLAEFLGTHGIPTIPTASLEEASAIMPQDGRVVIKPRFGAGSQGIGTADASSVHAYLDPPSTTATSQRIVQPLIVGEAFSIGTICRVPADDRESKGDILHTAHQFLSPDGRFQYLAGSIPACPPANDAMILIVDACRSLLPQLAGYIGFDFIIPSDAPDKPLLVEINPRLCTSYLGYRVNADENLAVRMLAKGPLAKLLWKPVNVTYFPNGDIRP